MASSWAREAQVGHEEEFFHTKAHDILKWGVVDTPSLEVFEERLDMVDVALNAVIYLTGWCPVIG